MKCFPPIAGLALLSLLTLTVAHAGSRPIQDHIGSARSIPVVRKQKELIAWPIIRHVARAPAVEGGVDQRPGGLQVIRIEHILIGKAKDRCSGAARCWIDAHRHWKS